MQELIKRNEGFCLQLSKEMEWVDFKSEDKRNPGNIVSQLSLGQRVVALSFLSLANYH